MKRSLTCSFAGALLAVSICCSGAASAPPAAPKPIVTVTRHGGLCVTRTECKSTLRITDTTISGDGYVSRRLKPAERLALLRAIRLLAPAYFRSHPFKGTCPTAYDGSESIYRFRGFAQTLPGCKYDLRGVKAVQLAARMLESLKPKSP